MRKNSSDASSNIASDWNDFITGHESKCHTAPPYIIESWRRCKAAGVDPYDGTCRHFLEPDNLSELLDKRKEFIDLARPIIRKLYEFVKGSGFIVILCDERGYIMEAFGDREALEHGAGGVKFVKGAGWAEDEVGTNAIGTCLRLKKPVQTSGAQHYCRQYHGWTCSACPIFDQQDQLIGILDMSGPLQEAHPHTLGMVMAAVEDIMEQMRISEKNRQLTTAIKWMKNVFHTLSDGIIVIDREGVINQINHGAQEIIGETKQDLLGHPIKEILGRNVPVIEKALKRKVAYSDREILVDTANGRVHCVSSGIPILDDEGSLTDIVILLRPIEKVNKLVNRFSGAHATLRFKDILGNSPQMQEVVKTATLAAAGSSNILLEGESGTGKEMFAQAIHNRSNRRKGPFVALNCGAIPRELIGSELFGYVEGAFTGASRGGRPGKIEMAAGGTLFLDEIGDMPLDQQVALLRVLQDKRICRIGDDKVIPVDFRVICATNKNLKEEMEKGNFRQDLYYRLNVICLHIPPLREHPEDISLLFDYFIHKIGGELGTVITKVDPQVTACLEKYDWPGNVRELQNVAERLISITDDGTIRLENLPTEILYSNDSLKKVLPSIRRSTFSHSATEKRKPAVRRQQQWGSSRVDMERDKKKQILAQSEYKKIIDLLGKYGGNISEIARELGLSRNTVYRKMRQYHIKKSTNFRTIF